ncbi:MAG: LPS assembly lipoprotein LptE [bacterium]
MIVRKHQGRFRTAVRAAAAWAFLFTFGCGYALEGTQRPEILKGAESITIPIFGDQTSEPGLGFLMAQRVRLRFLQDGRLRVVDGSSADVILEAVVREYRLDPIGFSQSDQVQRYRALVKIFIRLRDQRSGEILMKQEIENDSEFDVSTSITESASSRTLTNEKVADSFSEELVSLILEGF